jgi:CDP-diacylglycerol--serine O-phosphatidyltransferase
MLEVLQEYKLAGFAGSNVTFASFLQRFIWLAAATYISCAAIRLARFNVENEEDESAHMSFIGLPTPAAAGVIVSLIIFHQEIILPELLGSDTPAYLGFFEGVIIYALPFLILGVAVLMVSRIRYPHILNQYVKGKKPFSHLIWLLLGLGVVVWNIQVALALIFCGFAASSLVKWFYYKVIRKGEPILPALERAAEWDSEK